MKAIGSYINGNTAMHACLGSREVTYNLWKNWVSKHQQKKCRWRRRLHKQYECIITVARKKLEAKRSTVSETGTSIYNNQSSLCRIFNFDAFVNQLILLSCYPTLPKVLCVS